MKIVRIALALPAVFLLGTAQLGAQERDQEEQERIPAAGAQQQACEVSFYTVEASPSLQAMAVERTDPVMRAPGEDTRLGDGQELPLKGEKVMAVPIQTEPLTIWAEISPGLSDPRDVRVQEGDVQVQQAFALQALGDRAAHAARGGPAAQERQDRQAEEAGREIEPADRTEAGGMGAETSVLLLQLDTSAAGEGQVQLVIQDGMSECTGRIQLVETGAESFPQDDRMDPTERPEPTTGDDPDA